MLKSLLERGALFDLRSDKDSRGLGMEDPPVSLPKTLGHIFMDDSIMGNPKTVKLSRSVTSHEVSNMNWDMIIRLKCIQCRLLIVTG